MPDGRAVAEMSGLRESDARTLFQANEDQSLPPLRDAEVGGVEQAPVAIVAQPGKAFDDLGDGLAAFVRGESDDVFHDESSRAEVVHEVGELLKKAVARVVFIRGAEWADRRKALTGWPADDEPEFSGAHLELRAKVFAAHVADVSAQAECAGVVEAKGLDGLREKVDPEDGFVAGVARFPEAFRETAGAAEEVKNFHPVETIVASVLRGQSRSLQFVSNTDLSEKITAAIIELLADERKRQGLTYEDLAAQAGVDRSTVALWDRGERSPRMEVILKVCHALGLELSALLIQAEASASGLPKRAFPKRPPRMLQGAHFLNEATLKQATGLTSAMLRAGIEHCHQTFDTIDFQLELHGAKPIGRLVELANLSSMIGNVVAEGIAANSDGLYERNTPHTYPDLLPKKTAAIPLEVKIALETNRPKGHLPKPGTYLTFRYVLCGKDGVFTRGKDRRGDTPYIWEAKAGMLTKDDFDLSNTEGNSGKTAVVKTVSFDRMALVYFNPALMAYGRSREGYA